MMTKEKQLIKRVAELERKLFKSALSFTVQSAEIKKCQKIISEKNEYISILEKENDELKKNLGRTKS